MPNDQDDQQTADDQSTAEAAESDQQALHDQVTNENIGQTTDAQSESDQASDVQSAGDAGVAQTSDDCSGWFADAESTSKRAAEFYVRNELTGAAIPGAIPAPYISQTKLRTSKSSCSPTKS